MNRPVLWALLALIFSLIFTYFNIPFWLLIIPVVIIAVFPFIFQNISKLWIFLTLLVYFIGIIIGINAFQSKPVYTDFIEKESQIIGIIDDLPIEKENTTAFVLKTLAVNGIETNGKLQVNIAHYDSDYSTEFPVGNIVRFSGTIEEADSKRNPGGFDYKTYLKSKGIDGIVYLNKNTEFIFESSNQNLKYTLLSVRKDLENVVDRHFSSNQADVIKGILFGEKNISDDVKTQFETAGISHAIAVSGLHVGYIFILIGFICSLLRLKRKNKLILLTGILLFYLFLIGFPASAVRASIMLMILVLFEEFKLTYDSLSAWCLAAIIILIIQPTQLFQAGFQLSFGATLGIILFYKPSRYLIKHRIGKINKPSEWLLLALCALIGTIPSMVYFYQNINLLSLISGIIIVPFVGVLFVTAWLAMPFLYLNIRLFGYLPQALAQLILDLSHWLSGFKGLIFHGSISNLFGYILLFVIIFALTGYFCFKKKHHRIIFGIVISLCCIIMMISLMIPKPLTVTFLDVGQGDSTLIQTPGGKNYLIDGGGYENYDENKTSNRKKISEKVLLPALYALGITELDGVIITHNHADHAQGIEELLEIMPVRQIVMTAKDNNAALLEQKQIPVMQIGKGDQFDLDKGVHVNVLWPENNIEKSDDDQQNENSLVLKLSYGVNSFLFTSDIDETIENVLVSDDALQSTILKIAHHGSKTATGINFLQKVKPQIAVISVGKNNLFGHPAYEVLERLDQQQIITFRTDRNGAVVFTCDGDELKYYPYIKE